MADSKDLKKMVAANLRSVTQSCKGGVPFESLERDYRDLLGVTIPYRALGYPSLEAMIKAMPDVVRLQRNAAGKTVVMAVADASTAHIASLIARQKSVSYRRPTRSRRPERVRKSAVGFSKSSSVSSARHFNRGSRAPPSSYSETNFQIHSSIPDSSADKSCEVKSVPATAIHRGEQAHIQRAKPAAPTTFGAKYEVPPRFLRKQERPLSSLENNSTDHFSSVTTTAVKQSICQPPENTQAYTSPEATYFAPPPAHRTERTHGTESRSAREFIQSYATRNNLNHYYHTVPIGQKKKSFVSVLTLGDEKYRIYPDVKATMEEAEETAAEKARIAINQSEELQNLLPEVDVEDPQSLDLMLNRIEQMVYEKPCGIWNTCIPTEYQQKYQERLPDHWFLLFEKGCTFIYELVVDENRIILYPTSSGRVSPTSSSGNQDDESEIEDVEKKLLKLSVDVPDLEFPQSKNFDVFISNVQDTQYIAARLVDYAERFADLSEKMKLFYDRNKYPVSSVSYDKPYAVFVYGLWHRAVVEHIEGDMIVIHLVDEGDIIEVNISQLQELDVSFLVLPFQARIFKLAELDSYSVFIRPETLKYYLLGKTLVAEVVDMDECSITLYDTSTDEDINLNRIIFEKTVAESLNYTLPECGFSAVAYLNHVAACGTIYLNLNSLSTMKLFEELLFKLTPACQESAKLDCDLTKDCIYCAKYDSDTTWYRAIILDTVSEKKEVEVLYVDYGNTSVVPVSSICELKPVSKYLAELPFQAVACTLSELPPRNRYWSDKAIQRLGGLVDYEKELIVRVQKPGTERELPEVALFVRNEQSQIVSINQTLAYDEQLFSEVPSGKPEQLPDWTRKFLSEFKTSDYRPSPSSTRRAFADGSYPSESDTATNEQENLSNFIVDVANSTEQAPAKRHGNCTITSPAIGNECDNEEEQFPPLYPLDVPEEGNFFDVFVTMAASPFNFMCQPLQSSKHIDQLFSEMQSFYSNEENLCEMHSILVRKGEFFAGKHMDGCWYRVRKQSIVCEDPLQVSVYFVDYGDICIFSLPNLQPLFKQFRSLPCQCMKASLKGVRPNGHDWDPMECYEFKKMVEEKQFVSIVESKQLIEKDHLIVYFLELVLIDVLDPDVDVCIHEELIKKNLAQPAK